MPQRQGASAWVNWSASGYRPFQRRRPSALRSEGRSGSKVVAPQVTPNATLTASNVENSAGAIACANGASPILRLCPEDLRPEQAATLARLQHALKGQLARRRFLAELNARELRRVEGKHINDSLKALTQLLEAMQLPPVMAATVVHGSSRVTPEAISADQSSVRRAVAHNSRLILTIP